MLTGLVRVVMITALALPVAGQARGPGAHVDVEVDRSGLPTAVQGIDDVEQNLFQDGRVYIAGQPGESALAAFRDLGVTAVVNLRTPREMEDRQRVPYDEAAAVAELGMEYVWIPLGGDDHPYTSDAVDRFATVLEQHSGPVLVHCTMGWRASYLWVAYLIRHQGMQLADAVARGEAIAIPPSPLEGLIGRELALEYAQ
jgi:uncharacterized protein (TIGR01244 family)